jgi:hypothetical protein
MLNEELKQSTVGLLIGDTNTNPLDRFPQRVQSKQVSKSQGVLGAGGWHTLLARLASSVVSYP